MVISMFNKSTDHGKLLLTGFSLIILVAGERCNVTREYFERDSSSELKIKYKIVAGSERYPENFS